MVEDFEATQKVARGKVQRITKYLQVHHHHHHHLWTVKTWPFKNTLRGKYHTPILLHLARWMRPTIWTLHSSGVDLRIHKQIGMWLKRDWTSLQHHLFTTTNTRSMFWTPLSSHFGLKNVLSIFSIMFYRRFKIFNTIETFYHFVFELKRFDNSIAILIFNPHVEYSGPWYFLTYANLESSRYYMCEWCTLCMILNEIYCHMRNSGTCHVMRRVLGYINDQQLDQ